MGERKRGGGRRLYERDGGSEKVDDIMKENREEETKERARERERREREEREERERGRDTGI